MSTPPTSLLIPKFWYNKAPPAAVTLSLNVFFSVPLLTLIIGALSFLVSALLHQIPFFKKYFV